MFLDYVSKTFESIKLLSNILSVLQAEDQIAHFYFFFERTVKGHFVVVYIEYK